MERGSVMVSWQSALLSKPYGEGLALAHLPTGLTLPKTSPDPASKDLLMGRDLV